MENTETTALALSENRISANRRNAQKSTGPKTLKGKSLAKRNATTHGLLSKEIFLANENNEETRAEYAQLLRDLQQDFDPLGTREHMLVERMAVAWWRLARVLRFELRETRRAITVGGNRLPERSHGSEADDGIFERLREDPEQMLKELKSALHTLEFCCAKAEERGYLDEYCIELLKTLPGDIYQRYLAFMSIDKEKGMQVIVVVDPKLTAPGDTPENKVALMLAEEFRHLMRWQDICYIILRNPALRAVLRRPDLPDDKAIDRILRYETTMERQFYRAMDQLERLQRRRQGELVPAPVNARIALDR